MFISPSNYYVPPFRRTSTDTPYKPINPAYVKAAQKTQGTLLQYWLFVALILFQVDRSFIRDFLDDEAEEAAEEEEEEEEEGSLSPCGHI